MNPFFLLFSFIFFPTFLQLTFSFFLFAPLFNSNFGKTNTEKKRSTCLRGKKPCLGPFSFPSTEYLVYAKGTVFGMETKRKYNPDGKIQVFN